MGVERAANKKREKTKYVDVLEDIIDACPDKKWKTPGMFVGDNVSVLVVELCEPNIRKLERQSRAPSPDGQTRRRSGWDTVSPGSRTGESRRLTAQELINERRRLAKFRRP